MKRWKVVELERRGRRAAMRRDGHCCRVCGSADNLTVHHIRPRVLGGDMRLKNLVTLCEDDHQQLEQLGRYVGALAVWAIGRPLLALTRLRVPGRPLAPFATALAIVAALIVSHD